MTAKIVALYNHKGGIAKTTSVVNLASQLFMYQNKKVAIIDGDSQNNCPSCFARVLPKQFPGLLEVVKGEASIHDIRIRVAENEEDDAFIDIYPAGLSLEDLEKVVERNPEQHHPSTLVLYKHVFRELVNKYDFILVDCKPSMSFTNRNILTAADAVVLPMELSNLAFQGLTQSIDFIDEVREQSNPHIQIAGVFLTKVERATHQTVIFKTLNEYLKKKGIRLYKSMIPRSTKFENALTFDGTTAVLSKRMKKDNAVIQYGSLTQEIFNS